MFSPDGKWVAYNSNDSEVYVRLFPGSGPAWQVSTPVAVRLDGAPTAGKLFFMAPDSSLMAARVTMHASTFETATPRTLFRTHAVYSLTFSNKTSPATAAY